MCIWYFSAYDQPNGSSSRTFDYAQEFGKNGYKVFAFTNTYCQYQGKHAKKIKGLYQIEKFDDYHVVWLRSIAYKGNGSKRWANMFFNSFVSIYASFRLRKTNPKIVISPSVPLLLGLAGWFISVFTSSKFVFEVRDIWPQTLVDLGLIKNGTFLYFVLRKIEVFLYRKASSISVVLQGAKDHIVRSGVDGGKVFWHPNAPSNAKILPSNANDYVCGKRGSIFKLHM